MKKKCFYARGGDNVECGLQLLGVRDLVFSMESKLVLVCAVGHATTEAIRVSNVSLWYSSWGACLHSAGTLQGLRVQV